VPGRQLLNYPAAVQAGIRAHRAIDTFTDQHPIVRRTTARLRAAGYGKYAGVVSDMFFDHLLARDFAHYYPAEPLATFTTRVYGVLAAHEALFPAAVQRFFPHLVQHNWLLSYAQLAGLNRALGGLGHRAPASGMETAGAELVRHEADYQADFAEFFPLLQAYAASLVAELS
jgi:acyl carrier protein phosphodiesterase